MKTLNRRILSSSKRKSKMGKRVLVITTTGRKSGELRQTPLQYEIWEGHYVVASARGVEADWYCNLLARPQVVVQVGDLRFNAIAQPMTDRKKIADFLEHRLQKHPHFMGIMLRLEGLPRQHTRADLEKFADRLAIVKLTETDT